MPGDQFHSIADELQVTAVRKFVFSQPSVVRQSGGTT
jgi:hypothetical protein